MTEILVQHGLIGKRGKGFDELRSIFKETDDNLVVSDTYSEAPYAYTSAISPNGEYVVVGNQSPPRLLTLFKLVKGKLVLVSTISTITSPTFVTFSPDSKYIAVGNSSPPSCSLIKIVNDQMTVVSTYLLAGMVDAMAFSPDGGHIAVGYNASPYFTLIQRDGEVIQSGFNYPLQYGGIYAITFTSDGKYIALNQTANPYLIVLRVSLHSVVSFTNYYNLSALRLKFSPDDQYLVATGNPYITLLKLNYSSFTVASNLAPGGSTRHIAFSPGGRYLVASKDYTKPNILLLKRTGDTLKIVSSFAVSGEVTSVSFSPDGQYILVTHSGAPCVTLFKRTGIQETKSIKVDNVTFDEVKPIAYKNSYKSMYQTSSYTAAFGTEDVAFSPDGKYIALATASRLCLLRRDGDLTSVVFIKDLPNSVWAVDFSPDGQYIAISCQDTGIYLFKKNGEVLVQSALYSYSSCYDLAFSPDGQYIMIANGWGVDAKLLRIDDGTLTLVSTFINYCFTTSVSFSADSRYIAIAETSGGEHESITLIKRIGDVLSYVSSSLGYYTLTENSSCEFSPDGQYIAVTSLDSLYLSIFKRVGDTIDIISACELPFYGRKVRYSPDGSHIFVTSSEDNGDVGYIFVVKIDGDYLSVIGTYRLSGSAKIAQPSPDGQFLAVGYPDFRLLKSEWTFSAQPPVMVEYKGRRYKKIN